MDDATEKQQITSDSVGSRRRIIGLDREGMERRRLARWHQLYTTQRGHFPSLGGEKESDTIGRWYRLLAEQQRSGSPPAIEDFPYVLNDITYLTEPL